jgi:hypothetical protein
LPLNSASVTRLALSYEAPGLMAYSEACDAGRFSKRAKARLQVQLQKYFIDVMRAWPIASWGKA